MDYNSISNMKNKIATRVTLMIVSWIALEIVAFWGVAQWTGGYYAFWLTVGISFLGYMGKSLKPKRASGAWNTVCYLLMFPGFVLDAVALIVAIKPLRTAIRNRIMSKFLPPGLMQSFAPENAAKFSDFMRGMNGAGAPGGAGAQPKNRGKGEVIDIDEGEGYEVKYSGRHDVVMQKASAKPAKSLAAEEVIDVEHEWK